MLYITFLLAVGAIFYANSVSRRLIGIEKQLRRMQNITPSSSLIDVQGSATSEEVSRIPQASQTEPSWISQLSPTQVVGAVGVVALVLGVGFFFKYAIDQGWINELTRVLLGAIVGALVLGLSEIWHRQKTALGQVLSAGGLGIWYFTTFAGYSFYGLIGTEVAFAVLIVITLVGVLQAYRFSSKALGVVASIGAYIVPALVDFQDSQHTVMFVYLSLINAGSLAILSKKYWLELTVVAIVANFIHYSIWLSTVNVDETEKGMVFVLVNLAIMLIIHSVAFRTKWLQFGERVRSVSANTATVMGVTLFLAYFGLTASSVDGSQADILPLFLTLAGLVSLLAYTLVDRLEAIRVNWILSWFGKIFLVSAILWQFDKPVEVVYLVLLAIVGLAVGLGTGRRELRASALSVLTASSLLALIYNYFADAQRFMASPEFWVAVVCCVALAIASTAFIKYSSLLHAEEKQGVSFMLMLILAVIWLQVSWEIGNNLSGLSDNAVNLLMSLWWLGLGVASLLAGGFQKLRVYRVGGVALVALAVAKVFLFDSSALEMGYRVVSFIVLGVILISLAFTYEKNKEKLKGYLSLHE